MWQALSEAQGRGRGDAEIAILFTDLVDFSDWALEAGDEAALDLLRKVGTEEEAAICGRDGEVVKRMGDGLMAVFSDPASAVAAAHEACTRVSLLEAPGLPAADAGRRARGPPAAAGRRLPGVDVNIAARVAAAASADEVLVSGPGLRAARGRRVRAAPPAALQGQGRAEELEVYAAERPMKSSSACRGAPVRGPACRPSGRRPGSAARR